MKHLLMSASVEYTRTNRCILDGIIANLIDAVLDRNYRQVCMKSVVENGIYTTEVVCTAFPPKKSLVDTRKLLTHMALLNKHDPQFLIDFSVAGPLTVTPIEEFVEILSAEHGTIILEGDLE